MTDQKDDFQAQLAILRARFLQQLPEQLKQMTAALARAATEPDSDGLQALHHLAHRLHGSGGAFGFHALSTAAGELEQAIQQLTASPSSADGNAVERLGRLLGVLEHQSEATSTTMEVLPPGKSPSPASDTLARIHLLAQASPEMQELRQQLAYFGYAIEPLANWQALQALRADERGLALIDLDLLDAGVSLSAQADQPDMSLVFLSQQGDLATRLRAVRLGGSAFFQRPLDTTALIDAIDGLVTRAGRAPYRVLIVEDSSTLADYYALLLRQAGMQPRCLDTPLRVLDELTDFLPDIILMDLYLGACNGFELAAVIRQQATYAGIPIVFLSAERNLGKQMNAMRLGGDDFITKPVDPDRLAASLASRADRARGMRALMSRDSLTGLLNHTHFTDQLDIEVARARRQQQPFCLAMIDIDFFKAVNDQYGHPVGDRVIKSLARLLQQRLRKTDIIGRYGGEEFAVILWADLADSFRVLNDIREQFSHIRHQASDDSFHATISIGVTGWPQQDGSDALYEAADQALYQAKHQGRNQVVAAWDSIPPLPSQHHPA
ncbi:diguanylate cyclase [Thermithiobacillus plumbiphilus]|uniref:diguanylate cyclase n=1 Tax=Thermithiobacillus plumbiphilus TaxID=1729899 RepID=A0ABU9D9Z4_9PROT